MRAPPRRQPSSAVEFNWRGDGDGKVVNVLLINSLKRGGGEGEGGLNDCSLVLYMRSFKIFFPQVYVLR